MRLAVIVAACVVAGAAVLLAVVGRAYEGILGVVTDHAIKVARESFVRLEHSDAEKMGAALDAIASRRDLQELFAKRDRDALYSATLPLFEQLKSEYGITHLYFEDPEPESTVFLRMHRPEQWGDRVTRSTYLKAVESKQVGVGLDLGKTAFALRVVKPMKDADGRIIGYLELGEEIHEFLEVMHETTGDDYALVAPKRLMNREAWAEVRAYQGLPDNWEDDENTVLIDATTDDPSLVGFARDVEDLPDGGVTLGREVRGTSVYARGAFPVKDAVNRPVGAIVVLRDVTEVDAGMRTTRMSIVLALGVLLVVLLGLTLWSMDVLVMSRLTRIAARLEGALRGPVLRVYEDAGHPSDPLARVEALSQALVEEADDEDARVDSTGDARDHTGPM